MCDGNSKLESLNEISEFVPAELRRFSLLHPTVNFDPVSHERVFFGQVYRSGNSERENAIVSKTV